MIKINFIKKSVNFLILIILLANFVFAFGVASSYWKGNPLIISPGETETTSIRLQNMVSSDDEKVRVEVTKGNEIATIEQKDYLVKAGTKDTEVFIKITIPSDTPINTTYEVTLSSKTINTIEGGGVALGTGADTTFDVLVVPKTTPKEEMPVSIAKNLNWIIAVSILIAIIIIYIILKKRKK